jgi:trigger factor
MLARDRVAQAIADLVDMEIPPMLVEAEVDSRINDMAMRMRSQGIDFSVYMEAMGRDVESLREELREGAELSARVDLGLRAVADAEGLGDIDEQLEEYLGTLATQTGGDVDGIRETLSRSGRMLEVRADLRKQAALEWVFERAEVVDETGEPVDRELLEPPEPVIELPEELAAIPVDGDEVGETEGSVADLTDGEEE